jgi:hypothetical protein
MAWHVGPPRERLPATGDPLALKWHRIVREEAADAQSRWRLDAYISCVTEPVTIADTFIDEWLEGLWRLHTK